MHQLMRLVVGKFDVEAGSMRHRVGRVWVPDGLHVWYGNRGLHLFWSGEPHVMRDSDAETGWLR
jgi:hypothetical protein